MPKTVLARIKRFGNQFASCGVPLRPSNGLRVAKALCPKLVPGQVVELPEDSNTLMQDCIEVVRKVQSDEILRPVVFRTPEEAVMADPSRSGMRVDDIRAALQFAEGAKLNRRKFRQGEDADLPDELSDDENARRSQNRMLREEKEAATPRSMVKDLADAAAEDAAEQRLAEQKDGPVPPQPRRFGRARGG